MILTGRDIQLYIAARKLSISPISISQFQQNGVDLILAGIDSEDRGELHFRLGHTAETLKLPDDLMAFVEIRSTWARRGFFIPPTIVDAGFVGELTLEIINLGVHPYPVGDRFAHLIFARLSGPADSYRGKYQGQSGITEARDDSGVAESAAIPPAPPYDETKAHPEGFGKGPPVQDHGPRVDTRSDLGLERCPKCGSDERSMLCMECFRNERDPHPWHHS